MSPLPEDDTSSLEYAREHLYKPDVTDVPHGHPLLGGPDQDFEVRFDIPLAHILFPQGRSQGLVQKPSLGYSFLFVVGLA